MDSQFDDAVVAARGGADWAWSALYHWLSPRLQGYIRARGGRDSQDLLGEVWVQLARNMETFEGDASDFRSWAFTVAHHRVIDEARARKRKAESVPLDGHLGIAESAPRSAEPESEALEQLELEELVKLTGHLPEKQRSTLLLRVIGDLSVRQTAETLDMSEGAVKAAQHRAVKALRKILGTSETKRSPSSVTGL